MDEVFVGKLVNTRGLKGEVKVISDFELKKEVFKPGKTVYINGRGYIIKHYSTFKQFDLLQFEGIDDINRVEVLKGADIYVDRPSLGLGEDDYLLSDLFDMSVICDGEEIGVIEDYTTGINPLLEVKYNNKTYYIPLNANYIDHVSLEERRVYVISETKGLVL